MKINSNTCYHLYNRGNNKDLIFFDDKNYGYFLNQFKKHVLPFCEVFAYCLMPNHFHFFIRVTNKDLFERGLKDFFISFSKAINKKYNRVGSLFQGRYKVSEITSNSYFTKIITYIHQNPFVAKLVQTLGEYKCSSYNAYLSDKETVLSKKEVLEWFGGIDGFLNNHKIIVKDDSLNEYL
ncbi:transposase [Mucilaginibacter flavus]|uniref:transposase n=1 Tax=Mucilaginibacter flavus TaxID=931504 RepID=UPI0025B2EAE3|nr:transposase [Mucilaginibacter flavus]MDN3579846.1 transposase [Mucilaginibacter flavus]